MDNEENTSMNASDMEDKMSISEENELVSVQGEKRLRYHLRIPFPNELYATSAMNALGVDPPFQDSKTRKTTIRREMTLDILSDNTSILNIVLSCDDKLNDGIEI